MSSTSFEIGRLNHGETALLLSSLILPPKPSSDSDSTSDSDSDALVTVTRHKITYTPLSTTSPLVGWVSSSSRLSSNPFDITKVIPKGTWKCTSDGSVMVRFDPSTTTPSEFGEGGVKIAAFNLDGTLQVPTDAAAGVKPYLLKKSTSFKVRDGAVGRVRKLSSEGYSVVVFSNQGGIRCDVTNPKAVLFRERLEILAGVIGVPIDGVCATEGKGGGFRKPNVGMWDLYVGLRLGEQGSLNLKECFFVGDAAGRERDHGNEDREFAGNAGVEFITDTEFFEG